MARNDRFGPDRPDAIRLTRRIRVWSIFGIWMFILVFFVMPIAFGVAAFVLPAAFFGALLLATVRSARRPGSADSECLARDELRAATAAEPVAVHGVWSRGVRVRGEAAPHGLLAFDGTDLWFETTDGEVRMEAPIRSVGLAGPPTSMRPQLDLVIDGVEQTIRFLPTWDLGAMFVGPVIAGEWYAQLRELGAR